MTTNFKIFLTITFNFLLTSQAVSQGNSIVYYDLKDFEECRSIVKTNEQVFLSVTSKVCNENLNQISVLKLDNNLQLLDTICFDTQFETNANEIILLSQNILVVAANWFNTMTQKMESIIIKFSTDGNELDRLIIANPFANIAVKNMVKNISGESIFLSGFITDANGTNNVLSAKINSAFELEWLESFGGSLNDYGQGITFYDNKIYIVADSRSFNNNDYDPYLLCLDTNGLIIYEKIYDWDFNNGTQGIIYDDNALYFFGETEIEQFSPFDHWVCKTNLMGDTLWLKVFGGVGPQATFSGTICGNNKLCFTGYDGVGGAPYEIAYYQMNTEGSLLFYETLGRNSIDIGYQIIFYNNMVYFAGTSGNGIDTDVFISKKSTLNNVDELYSNLNIYPNPFQDRIYFNLNLEIANISVTDQLGKPVYFTSSNLNSNYILLGSLNDGFYTVNFQLKNGNSIFKKVIKQN